MAGDRESLIPYSSGQHRSLAYIRIAYTATAVVPPPAPRVLTPRDMREMFIRMEVTRPEILLRKEGLPQAATFFTRAAVKFGFTNFSRARFPTKGTMAAKEQVHMEMDVASAEPTTSMPQPSRNNASRPMVRKLLTTLMTMLVFTYPLIRR